MKKLLLYLIRFYQRRISHLKSKPCCRFYPTCSTYAIEAIEGYGAFFGTLLAVKRILKCNPLFKGGIDHVPESILGGRIKRKPNNRAEGN